MLDLSYNALVGPIPASIGECSVVSELVLKGNHLNGSIPHEKISGLSSLTFLALSMNCKTDIPEWYDGYCLSSFRVDPALGRENSAIIMARLLISYIDA